MFADFYEEISKLHKRSPHPHRGHGIDHDITVAQIVDWISPNPRVAQKAWCAALLHSVDHLVDKDNEGLVEQQTKQLLGHLPLRFFANYELAEICQAAVRHGERNQDDQSLVQQVLMDADRLANLMPAVIIRSGQFRPEIPAFEFDYLNGERNPASTYHRPKSVADGLRANIAEYLPMLRIIKAKELARQYISDLETFLAALEKSYEDLGMRGIKL